MLGGYLHELTLFPKKINSALIFFFRETCRLSRTTKDEDDVEVFTFRSSLPFIITQRKQGS